MRIFHLSSSVWRGYIEFVFNDLDLLEKMSIHADLSQPQQVYLLKNMPRELAELEHIKTPNVTIIEVKQEITFEMLWNKYDDKVNSSRKKALAKWNKMSPVEQARAFYFVSRYFSCIPDGTRKKYVETYLNSELWNN